MDVTDLKGLYAEANKRMKAALDQVQNLLVFRIGSAQNTRDANQKDKKRDQIMRHHLEFKGAADARAPALERSKKPGAPPTE